MPAEDLAKRIFGEIPMIAKGVVFATMAIVGVGFAARIEAQPPCPELIQLRNAASESWKQAMKAPRSERCGALNRASSATEVTLRYAENNRESCAISAPILNQVERYHDEAVQARDNVCAGRPLRPYPAEIIQR